MLWTLSLWGCFTTAWKVLDVLWGSIAVNSLTPELNPFMQRCLTRFFTAGFAS
jgi:hypothetical protein